MNSSESSKRKRRESAIISLLFVNGDPLTAKRIAEILEEKESDIKTNLDELVQRQPINGLKILGLENKYQLVSDPDNALVVKKIKKNAEEETLGPGSLEVLSVVIYQGPITKGEIELIRGINSSQALRNLMIKGLVEEKEMGGVVKYAPTINLLRALGVVKIEDTPDYEAIRNDERIKKFLNRAINDSVDDQRE